MGRETWTYNQSTEINLLKETFGQLQEQQFNKNNPIMGRAKKKDDFDGEFHSFPVEQSIGGGVSAGSLGRSSRNKNLRAQLRRKKLYGTVAIDRETMKVARGGASAFVQMTSYAVRKLTESFARNIERQMTLNDLAGSGLLATVDGTPTGAGTEVSPYVLPLEANTVMEQFEEGDVVHLNTDATDATACEIVEVTVGTSPSISIIGSPAVAPADDDEVYMQFSRNAELPGLQGVLKATTGTYKNIAIGRRWQATQEDASAAAISTSILNDVISRLEKTCGESPKMLLCSYEQYTALLDLSEDQKRYEMRPRGSNDVKSVISYSGIEFMVGSGPIPVLRSRFVPAAEIYILNDDKMHLKCAPGGFEWFDEDGTVFLRDAVEDKYNARYGGYADFYVNPHFQAIIFNLAV